MKIILEILRKVRNADVSPSFRINVITACCEFGHLLLNQLLIYRIYSRLSSINILGSKLCRIFRLRGVHKIFGGSDFLRVERNFTIGQIPKIWGNFSKICIKFNKNLPNYWENSRKMQILRKVF